MHLSSALLIGAGGTGGQLIAPLARLLTHHPNAGNGQPLPFALIDGDAFEDHNQIRQHAGPAQIGRNKADWTAELCANQGLNVTPHGEYLDLPWLRRHLRRCPAGMALVVAAVDNDATRKLCIDGLLETDRDFLFLTPGNSAASDPAAAIKGNVLWFGRQGEQALGLNPALVFPNIETPQDAAPRYGSCAAAAPSAPQLITANALAAAWTLAVLQNLLDGAMAPEASSCFFNGRRFAITAS